MGCIGILGGYLLIDWDEIKSNGTSKVFFQSIVGCSTSYECGWLGPIELFFSIIPAGHKLNNKEKLET